MQSINGHSHNQQQRQGSIGLEYWPQRQKQHASWRKSGSPSATTGDGENSVGPLHPFGLQPSRLYWNEDASWRQGRSAAGETSHLLVPTWRPLEAAIVDTPSEKQSSEHCVGNHDVALGWCVCGVSPSFTMRVLPVGHRCERQSPFQALEGLERRV